MYFRCMTKENRNYARDGRAPVPKSEHTSRLMSANKGTDTKPEILLRKALFTAGIRGYRTHWKKAPGNPDIAFVGRKIAVFVHGCFWHRCPKCHPHMPKTHTAFWERKFEKNVERDIKVQQQLKDLEWRTLVIWECETKEDLESCVEQINLELMK